MRKTLTIKKKLVGICLAALFSVSGEACAELYLYAMPDGTRMLTDHLLNDKGSRLLRVSGGVKGAGKLIAHKDSSTFRGTPSAYDRLIRHHADQYGVEFALVKAIMQAESSFNPYALSTKGACGLMQLLPATASRYGVRDIYDPVENVRVGVQHLKYLSEMFGNNHYLIIAAYNAGENAVKRHQGIPPYEETQSYVRKVLSYKRQYGDNS